MVKYRKASCPYEGYRLYGPTFHKKEGRYYVFLIDKLTHHRTTLSYARYLMSVHVGRVLYKTEEVDHIDGIKTNDTIENLQILTQLENNRKAVQQLGIKKTILEFICPTCGKHFTRARNQTYLVKGGTYAACSRSCSSKYEAVLKKNTLKSINQK